MFEIFLFVNPIGIYCYNTEVLIKDAIDELNINSSFHFVPIINAKVIKEDIIRRKNSGQKIKDIPQYTIASFQALRHYNAIKIEYGNKKARAYLVALQRVISTDFNKYSESLPREIAKSLGLDFNRINSRKIAHYVDDSIQQDKDLARKFNVRNFPTTVIFNESGNYNGVMLEGVLAHDKLIKLLKDNGCVASDPKGYYPVRHLRLI